MVKFSTLAPNALGRPSYQPHRLSRGGKGEEAYTCVFKGEDFCEGRNKYSLLPFGAFFQDFCAVWRYQREIRGKGGDRQTEIESETERQTGD